jgi:phosphoribosylformimino-5-aminoimidazole carboxamide ribotide isomerase
VNSSKRFEENEMIIYPDIEIRKGKCVSLRKGRFEDPLVYDIDPQTAAKNFESEGAEWLHVVDMDSVFNDGENREIVERIVDDANIPVQVSGGIRTLSQINKWLELGAARVVLGTVAVTDRTLIHDACGLHPDKIAVSIDAKDGHVMIDGWRTKTAFTGLELAKLFEQSGVAAIIYTDIDLYQEAPESSLANTTEIAGELDIPVISSGTIRSLDDISRLNLLPNIHGTVTGWALFNNEIELKSAISIGHQEQVKAELI